jgi:hypothetical protein
VIRMEAAASGVPYAAASARRCPACGLQFFSPHRNNARAPRGKAMRGDTSARVPRRRSCIGDVSPPQSLQFVD